ncbi:mannitol-1-phosphate 5-dehydrogenase [Pontibacillus salicampi]|uniref:Mannitol-1-phosphate 5-dehydrogenase n=1 Tax=Pontibacillus salicampi TaxID=1449801 RepID=A0ABV6LRY3_9BACI
MIAVHFGAGNIGRGFIGSLLYDAGYETVFVDVNETLINGINEQGAYTIELAGQKEEKVVTNIAGLNSRTQPEAVKEAIQKADVITTAVGPQILPIIAKTVAEGLEKRVQTNASPINIIACENMIGGSEALRESVLENVEESLRAEVDQTFGFPNAAVDRIVPEQHNENPLTVKVEPYYEWVVETSRIKGDRPDVAGIKYVEELTPYIERKLFTVNTGHAAAAYLGSYYDHKTIKQAMDNPEVKEKVRSTLQETGEVLIEKYNFGREEHQAYINTIIERYLNPDLSDDVTRVARAPKRKLGPNDRLVRPALAYSHLFREEPKHLAEVIAAALLYKNENDPEAVALQTSIQEQGVRKAFQEISEVEDEAFLHLVETCYGKMT